MKKTPIWIVALFLMPVAALGAGAPSFEDGKDEFVVNLTAPNYNATVNLVVPADYYVKNAIMKVTGMAADGNASAYPENVTLRLNDTVLWGFNKAGYGPLGMQHSFSTGEKEMQITFGPGGGFRDLYVSLPKDAIVQSAELELTGSAPIGVRELINSSGFAAYDRFGKCVSNAGDVNNDGYNDVIVGAPCDGGQKLAPGYAVLSFGGPDFDNSSDIIFTGEQNEDYFGGSVSCAGDVNNDGYDDIVIGATGNDMGASTGGKVYIYYGGRNMDNISDVAVTGTSSPEALGMSVSGAGDVNGDGYDDVIVGGTHVNNCVGHALLFFGGQDMDNISDVEFSGEGEYDYFGGVSGAGDLNGDGFYDVIIGANQNDGGGNNAGRAYIFFGGKAMDNVADFILTGNAPGDYFGCSVSDAGDVNNDGFSDVIVGAIYNDLSVTNAGSGHIYYGGKFMDNIADMVLVGAAENDSFGGCVRGAGDLNGDGYDDVMVSAYRNDVGGSDAGRVYMYFGGSNMDNITDATVTGNNPNDRLGMGLYKLGDVNGDGFKEIIVGGPFQSYGGYQTGRAYVYSFCPNMTNGLPDTSISIRSTNIWNISGPFNGTSTSGDFAQTLNNYLRSSVVSNMDEFDNAFVTVPFRVNTKGPGILKISNIEILYQYDAVIPDFGCVLDDYLDFTQDKKDSYGDIHVPFIVRSTSPGSVMLSELDLNRDLPPSLVETIQDIMMCEDTVNLRLLDLYPFFRDDTDKDSNLRFSIVFSTNRSFVTVGIVQQRYLGADTLTGDANDNWTGTVEAAVACSDRWGQKTESNMFTIVVTNINDPPEITSIPITNAEPGVQYAYNVVASDVDNDVLQFSLAKAPRNMTIDSIKGRIVWLPQSKGVYEVNVIVDDGNCSVEQEFTITVPNRPPEITSNPPLNAFVGVPYIYSMTAEDANCDALHFEVGAGPNGMRVDSESGVVSWTPVSAGDFDVALRVSDTKEMVYQEFSINVVQGNRAPEFKSKPIIIGTVDLHYSYSAVAKDMDNDVLSYSIDSGPDGMTIDAAKGKVVWTPASAGNFNVILNVSDGRGGEAKQEFVINVADAVRPQVVLTTPSAGEGLRGIVVFSGIVTKGTREVIQVQMRVDGGEWKDAVGAYSWGYTLNTKSLKNGKHAFEFRAYDGKEYSDVVKAEFKVDNTVGRGKGFIPMMDGITALSLVIALSLLWFLKMERPTSRRRR